MIFPLADFEEFCATLLVPSKDRGIVPMSPLYGGQQYGLHQLAAGLEDDIHEFVILAGRQMGKTTAFVDALSLFWLMRYGGMTGILVSDNEGNRDYRRDVLLQMLSGLPRSHRYPVRLNNTGQLAWEGTGSRLMFAAVGSRENRSFGRSRGINVGFGDEVGAWPFQKAVSALQAAFSETHPHRLYIWASTAQGHDVFKDLWDSAASAQTRRRIFLGPWLHDAYRVPQTNHALWDAYGREEPTDDERLWLRAIKARFDYETPPEYVVWRRYQLAEKFFGDEDMLNQEYPNLPEDAFVSFGDKFIPPVMIRKLRSDLESVPDPEHYTYRWGSSIDTMALHPSEDGALEVWNDPHPGGTYIVATHPAYSSSEKAGDDVITVWRAFPDVLEQVAQYVLRGGGPTYHLAWAAIHLAGAYRVHRLRADIYLICDVQMTGRAVYAEMKRIEDRGYGFSQRFKEQGREIVDAMSAVRHYLFRRPDAAQGGYAWEWQSTSNYRPMLLNAMRDELDREHVIVKSPDLIDELAALRRGEAGDPDVVAAGGKVGESLAMSMAMAIQYWLETVQGEIGNLIAPKEPPPTPRHVGEMLVGNLLDRLARTGRT